MRLPIAIRLLVLVWACGATTFAFLYRDSSHEWRDLAYQGVATAEFYKTRYNECFARCGP